MVVRLVPRFLTLALATAFLALSHHSRELDVHSLVSESQPDTTSPLLERRRLQLFRDVKIGDFLNKGSINVACFVELPDWWHEMHSVPKSQKILLKLTRYHSYASKEIDALERLNQDHQESQASEDSSTSGCEPKHQQSVLLRQR